jgi:hypothetical protein
MYPYRDHIVTLSPDRARGVARRAHPRQFGAEWSRFLILKRRPPYRAPEDPVRRLSPTPTREPSPAAAPSGLRRLEDRADSRTYAGFASPARASGPRSVPVHPVNGNALPEAGDKLVGDHPQGRLAHHLLRALVLGEGVVEGDFLIAEACLLSPLALPPGCPWQARSALPAPGPMAFACSWDQRASFGTQKMFSARYSSGSSAALAFSASKASRFASKACDMTQEGRQGILTIACCGEPLTFTENAPCCT